MAVEMMAAPYGGRGRAVVLGRSGGPRRSAGRSCCGWSHLTGIADDRSRRLPPV